MFPEYRDLIHELKSSDKHFERLFEEHNRLDHEIKRLEINPVTANTPEVETLKKQKLHLKDEMYVILKKVADERGQ